MKKYDTLKKELERIAENDFIARLKEIAENEAVNNFESFKARDAMYLLQYEQFAKAFTNKKYVMILDINYEASRLDSIDLRVSTLLDTANKRVLHFYSHDTFIDIVISSNKATVSKLDYIEALNTQQFIIERKKKYETVLKRVSFDDIVKAVDFAKLILESSIDDLQAMTEAKKEAEAE